MMHTGQESRRAMEDYIKCFDLQKFPGEDVTNMCICIKAVACSLGTNRLPLDIIHRVLEGFARVSTPEFQNLCHSQESMLSSTLIQRNLRSISLYSQLISILTDLENKFIDLCNGRRWLGLGHNSEMNNTLVFTVHATTESSINDDDFAVYVAKHGRHALPFNVWVKDKVCHNCGELGHIKPNCPHPPQDTAQKQSFQKVPPASWHNSLVPPNKSRSSQEFTSTSNHNHHQHPKTRDFVKALLSACHKHLGISAALSDQPSNAPADEVESDTTVDNYKVEDAPTSFNHSSFFAALGCPKEEAVSLLVLTNAGILRKSMQIFFSLHYFWQHCSFFQHPSSPTLNLRGGSLCTMVWSYYQSSSFTADSVYGTLPSTSIVSWIVLHHGIPYATNWQPCTFRDTTANLDAIASPPHTHYYTSDISG